MNLSRGRRCEKQTALIYKAQGYSLITSHFRYQGIEMDLVLIRGRTLILVEVKSVTAWTLREGQLKNRLSAKQKRRLKCAYDFLMPALETEGFALLAHVAYILDAKSFWIDQSPFV